MVILGHFWVEGIFGTLYVEGKSTQISGLVPDWFWSLVSGLAPDYQTGPDWSGARSGLEAVHTDMLSKKNSSRQLRTGVFHFPDWW